MESSAETLILFKTTQDCLGELEETVLKNHPYDTPEIIALPLESGNSRYLRWILQSVRSNRSRVAGRLSRKR